MFFFARLAPEVALGPVLHPDGGEKDVTFDEGVGGIVGKRGMGTEEHSSTDQEVSRVVRRLDSHLGTSLIKAPSPSLSLQLFPSPPPSHESSPSIQFSFDSPSPSHSHASRDASSISQASTTAVVSEADIAPAEREKFADFRESGGGEGEDGLGLELRKGRKNLKRFEQDEEEGRGRGLTGSRGLRDGLKTDVSMSLLVDRSMRI